MGTPQWILLTMQVMGVGFNIYALRHVPITRARNAIVVHASVTAFIIYLLIWGGFYPNPFE